MPQNNKPPGCLFLLPFLVEKSLPTTLARHLRKRGRNAFIAEYLITPPEYPHDGMDDFRQENLLLDLKNYNWLNGLPVLKEFCLENNIKLIVQVGAPDAYLQLPHLRYDLPDVVILDWLFNPYGHTLRHFLHENAIDAAVLESQFMHEFYCNNSVKENPKTHVVLSGVDLSDFHFVDRKLTKRLTVGYFGRLSDEKNPFGFIEIAKEVGKNYPNMDFVILGGGPQKKEISDAVDAANMGDQLQYLGFAPSAHEALASLDVLIVPSKYDGRPVAVMESSATGTPMIAAPVGGIPEMIVEGVNGVTVDPEDFTKIGKTLDEWHKDPKAYSALRKAARSYALKEFEFDRMIDDYDDLFKSYLESNPAMASD